MNYFPLNEKFLLSTNIYYYLWKKSINKISCPNIIIPDTIILKENIPIIWYFHSSKNGLILKKNRENLNIKTILIEFSKGRKLVNNKGCENVIAVLYIPSIKNDKQIITIEYLTISELKNYFNCGGKYQKVILQKYIEPSVYLNI